MIMKKLNNFRDDLSLKIWQLAQFVFCASEGFHLPEFVDVDQAEAFCDSGLRISEDAVVLTWRNMLMVWSVSPQLSLDILGSPKGSDESVGWECCTHSI